MKTLPIAFLRECFEYDEESGRLTWKVRPRSHFRTDSGFHQSIAKYAGKEAGTVSKTTGYRYINFNGDMFGAHRIILAMTDGAWPDFVDHIDGNRSNNCRANLRSCTKSDNLCNQGKQASNTSGYKGVCHYRGRWLANIQRHGKQRYLGAYATPELAHAAYKAAALRYHGAFANAG